MESDRRSLDRQIRRQEIHLNMYGRTLSEFLSRTAFGRGELWPKNRVDSVAKGAGVRARFAILIADSTKTFPVPGRPGSPKMYVALCRGITVKPEDAPAVCERIRSLGLANEQGRTWKFKGVDLRSKLRELFEKPDLTTEDTRPSRRVTTDRGWHLELIDSFPAICACADILGASCYALKHNQNRSHGLTRGLVITFRAEIADIHVDGNDFLYNSVFRVLVFQSSGRARVGFSAIGWVDTLIGRWRTPIHPTGSQCAILLSKMKR